MRQSTMKLNKAKKLARAIERSGQYVAIYKRGPNREIRAVRAVRKQARKVESANRKAVR